MPAIFSSATEKLIVVIEASSLSLMGWVGLGDNRAICFWKVTRHLPNLTYMGPRLRIAYVLLFIRFTHPLCDNRAVLEKFVAMEMQSVDNWWVIVGRTSDAGR